MILIESYFLDHEVYHEQEPVPFATSYFIYLWLSGMNPQEISRTSVMFAEHMTPEIVLSGSEKHMDPMLISAYYFLKSLFPKEQWEEERREAWDQLEKVAGPLLQKRGQPSALLDDESKVATFRKKLLLLIEIEREEEKEEERDSATSDCIEKIRNECETVINAWMSREGLCD